MADLLGKTILVTRALHQAEELVTAIERMGGQAIVFPTIDIVPPTSWSSCDSAIRAINSYDALLFTSTNGVEFFFRRLDELQLQFNVNGKKVYAVGSSTKHLLEEHHVRVSPLPEKFTAEDLANSLSDDEVRGKKFLYPRGNLGRDVLIENILSRGGIVQAVEVYQTIPAPHNDVARIYAKLASGQIHAVTFTSPSTIKNFASLFTKEMMQEIYRHAAFAVIGPATAEASTRLGFPPHVIASQSTINSLVHDLARYFAHQ